jgi:hypothetical protein
MILLGYVVTMCANGPRRRIWQRQTPRPLTGYALKQARIQLFQQPVIVPLSVPSAGAAIESTSRRKGTGTGLGNQKGITTVLAF